MSDTIDLSQLGKTEDPAPKFEDLNAEQQATAAAMAEKTGETSAPPTETIPVHTAFLVIVFPDGNVEISPDVARGADLEPDHIPVIDEVFGALAAAMDDITTSKTAQKVQHAMQQVGQTLQAQQQAVMEEARIRAQMEQGGPGAGFLRR